MATAQDAAEWMFKELQERTTLTQSYAAHNVARLFGLEHTYINKNGNRALSQDVLKAFNALTPTTEYVWSRSDRKWRKRRTGDQPGRAQR